MHSSRLLGGQHGIVYEEIVQWMATVPDARFNEDDGWSWINGKIFYREICFLREEDLLAFKLKFAGSVA